MFETISFFRSKWVKKSTEKDFFQEILGGSWITRGVMLLTTVLFCSSHIGITCMFVQSTFSVERQECLVQQVHLHAKAET